MMKFHPHLLNFGLPLGARAASRSCMFDESNSCLEHAGIALIVVIVILRIRNG
jgi:hypothetical protein